MARGMGVKPMRAERGMGVSPMRATVVSTVAPQDRPGRATCPCRAVGYNGLRNLFRPSGTAQAARKGEQSDPQGD